MSPFEDDRGFSLIEVVVSAFLTVLIAAVLAWNAADIAVDGEASGGSVNQKDFCHPIATDLASIDEL